MAVNTSVSESVRSYSVSEGIAPKGLDDLSGAILSASLSTSDAAIETPVYEVSQSNLYTDPRMQTTGWYDFVSVFGNLPDVARVAGAGSNGGSYTQRASLQGTGATSFLGAHQRPALIPATGTYTIRARVQLIASGIISSANLAYEALGTGSSYSSHALSVTSGWQDVSFTASFTAGDAVYIGLSVSSNAAGLFGADIKEVGVYLAGDEPDDWWFGGDTAYLELDGERYIHSWEGAPLRSASLRHRLVRHQRADYRDVIAMQTPLQLWDSRRGMVSARMSNTTRNVEGNYTFDGVGTLAGLNVVGTVPPTFGTLTEHVKAFLDASEVADAAISIPTLSVANTTGPFPGYTGNLWLGLNQFLAAHALEIAAQSGGGHVIRKHFTSFIPEVAVNSRGWSEQLGVEYDSYRYVDVHWRKFREDGLVSNVELRDVAPNFNEDIISVDAGEVAEFLYDIDGSVAWVNQPTMIDTAVDPGLDAYNGTNGVYAVAGNDGLPITASWWEAYNGSVKVETTDDPSVIKVIVRGPTFASQSEQDSLDVGPYRLAMTAGTSSYYNALRITGKAIRWSPKVVRIPTGVNPRMATMDGALDVTNPFVTSLTSAIHSGAYSAEAASGRFVTVSMDTDDPRFTEFGAGAGANFRMDDYVARITDIQYSHDSVALTGVMDTNLDRFTQTWASRTLANLETEWDGHLLGSMVFRPLKREVV